MAETADYADILCVLQVFPSERLDYVDREWTEIQVSSRNMVFRKHGTEKRSKPAGP